MEDKERIKELYFTMYEAMINKDRESLEKVHDETFVLHHMTGMKQNKNEYIASIMNGTLNYYSQDLDDLKIEVNGNKAIMKGKSRVSAVVFGGGRHTWRLALDFELIRRPDGWKLIQAKASTY